MIECKSMSIFDKLFIPEVVYLNSQPSAKLLDLATKLQQ